MAAEKIPLEPVESSNIAALGYNPEKLILAIQSKAGTIFHYAGVPLDVAAGFLGAESIGRFYVERVKGKFTGQRMTGLCAKCGDEGWEGETCADCGTRTYVVPPMKPRVAP